MKRFLFAAIFLCLLLACLCFPGLVLAGEMGENTAAVTDYLKPVEFASFAGQVTFVVLVVQFIKLPVDAGICKIKTEYIVYGVAVIAQVLAQAMLSGFLSFTWAFLPKCIAHAFLVAVVAKETYNKAIGNVEAKKAALKAKAQEPSV